jgi:hypothetical protein
MSLTRLEVQPFAMSSTQSATAYSTNILPSLFCASQMSNIPVLVKLHYRVAVVRDLYVSFPRHTLRVVNYDYDLLFRNARTSRT